MIAIQPGIPPFDVTAAPLLCDKCKTCNRADDDEEIGSSKGPKFELMFCADCMSLNNSKPTHDVFANIPKRKRKVGGKRKLPPSNSLDHDKAPSSIELISSNA